MKKKRILIVAAALAVIICTAAALNNLPFGEKEKTIKIGVSLYDRNDVFISAMTESIEKYVKDYEQSFGVKISLDISDAQNSQRIQNDQIERYINLGYDVVCVNIVDRTNASFIIEKATAAGTPVIFFNREPVKEDIMRSADIYYVGSNALETAEIQGKIIHSVMSQRPEIIDLNGDGIINYAMLEGEPGHQDAIIRTKYVITTLTDCGYSVQRVCGSIANWSRSQAAAFVSEWMENPQYLQGEDMIELIICNNDSMALGAADILSETEHSIGIVGIDGIPEAYAAVQQGRMLGTVDCNADGQAYAIVSLALNCAGKTPPVEDIQLTDGHYVRVPLASVIIELR